MWRRYIGAQNDLAPIGKLTCIAQQVEQDLPQSDGIGVDQRQACGNAQPALDAALQLEAGGDTLEDILQKRAGGDRLGEELKLIDLGARKIQQVVDQTNEMLSTLIDMPEIMQQPGW